MRRAAELPVGALCSGGAGASALDFGLLYREDSDWLRGWLRRRIHCPQLAADLVQDTFHRLIERGQALPSDMTRPYLAVVARRLLIDQKRRQRVEQLYIEALSATGVGIDELTPERISSAVRELAAIADLLSGLPHPVMEAFLLRRLDGLSHSGIASRMGLSDRTVKRHIARALEHLYNAAWLRS